MDYHGEDEIPDDLLEDLAVAPVIPEHEIEAYVRHGKRAPSAREMEVLRCVSYGLDYKMTAVVLGIKEQAVQEHLKRIRYRLKAKNTTHAVALALRRGLIS